MFQFIFLVTTLVYIHRYYEILTLIYVGNVTVFVEVTVESYFQ